MDHVEVSLAALRRILLASELHSQDLARRSGLTVVQFRVLQIVADAGSTTPTTIAQRMAVSQATVTALLGRLVDKGMVCRSRSEIDRRQTDIQITDLGRVTVEGATDNLQKRFVRQFQTLPEWEKSMMVATLQRLAMMLEG